MKKRKLSYLIPLLGMLVICLAFVKVSNPVAVSADGFSKTFEAGMPVEEYEADIIEANGDDFYIVSGFWPNDVIVSGCSVTVATGAALHISDSLVISGGSLTACNGSAKVFLKKGVSDLPSNTFFYFDEDTTAFVDLSGSTFWTNEIASMGDEDERCFEYKDLGSGRFGWTFAPSYDFFVRYDGEFAPSVSFALRNSSYVRSVWYPVTAYDPNDNDGHNFFINPEIYTYPTGTADITFNDSDFNTILLKFEIPDTMDFVDVFTENGPLLDGIDPETSASEDPVYYYIDAESHKKGIIVRMQYSDNGHNFNFTIAYTNSGNPEIVDAAKEYIYAFDGNYDFEGAGSTDTGVNMKYALAGKLYWTFIKVPQFETFGFNDRASSTDDNHNINELASRITLTAGSSIIAYKSDGSTVTIPTYKATVNWGLNMYNGDPIVSTDLIVYQLPDVDYGFLVCLDFNSSTGTGTIFFYRNVSDESPVADRVPNGVQISYALTSSSNVVAGGNSYNMQFRNTDTGLCTFDLYNEGDFYNSGNSPSVRVRIYNPAKNYVAVVSSGENLRYDDTKNDDGSSTDDIWEVEGTSHVRVYVGNDTIKFNAFASAVSITAVTLKDASQAGGVEIDTTDLSVEGDVTVRFLSNYYDTVTLVITYSDGTQKDLVIERQGLVIQYQFLGGPNAGEIEQIADGNPEMTAMYPGFTLGSTPNTGTMTTTWEYDCYNRIGGPAFTYSPALLDEWGAPFDWGIVVMAVYYHPTASAGTGSTDLSLVVTYDDGAMEIISKDDSAHNFNGYTSGSAKDAVDTTAFILGFMPAHTYPNNNLITNQTFTRNGHTGGLSITVVNAGFGDDDSFGGTQFGSGKGYHWDGSIRW